MKQLNRYPIWPQFLGVLGIFGFLGLLIASVFHPHWETALRIAAILWFLSVGVVKICLDLRAESRFGGRYSRGRPRHSRGNSR